MTPAIDAVIVHYTGAEHLRRCVAAIRQAADRHLAIRIVDNDAPEPVPEAIVAQSDVLLLRPGANLGFARGTNLGARGGEAEYLLFVNPDVRLSAQAMRTLAALLDEHPRVAACGPTLINPDGTGQVGSAGYLPSVTSVTSQALALPYLSGGRGRSLFVPAHLRAARRQFRSVDWLSAACMLIRRRAFEQVGGFDERFFLYGEDIDLGKRLRDSGWQMAYVPEVRVEHEHLHTDRQQAQRAPDWAWLDGLDLYYRLHTPRVRRLLHAIGWIGFALRALAYTVQPGHAHRRAHRDRMVAFMRRSAHHASAG